MKNEMLFWCPLWDSPDGSITGSHNKNTRIVIERNNKAITSGSPTHILYITDLDHATGLISKVKYAPLWEKISKVSGLNYFTGDDGSRIRLVVQRNQYKETQKSDNPPDWIAYKILKEKHQ